MSAPDFRIAVGDDKVPWSVTVLDQAGVRVEVFGATAVTLRLHRQDRSAAAVNLTGSVVGIAGVAQVSYLFLAADTNALPPGLYDAVWLVTLASTERITYPLREPPRYFVVEIVVQP